MMTKNVRNVWTGAGRSPNLPVMSESGAFQQLDLGWYGALWYGAVGRYFMTRATKLTRA